MIEKQFLVLEEKIGEGEREGIWTWEINGKMVTTHKMGRSKKGFSFPHILQFSHPPLWTIGHREF